MKYQIVTNGARKAEVFDTFQPIACFAARGYRHTGTENHAARRAELQGQPKFDGLAGPMWGGTDPGTNQPIIRYEDWGSYDILSR